MKYYRDWNNSYWKIEPNKDALYLLWGPNRTWVLQSIPLSLSRFRDVNGYNDLVEVSEKEMFIELI